MTNMIYCECGCVWNGDNPEFIACPKCGDDGVGPNLNEPRECYSCGAPLTHGECADQCERCWNEDRRL